MSKELFSGAKGKARWALTGLLLLGLLWTAFGAVAAWFTFEDGTDGFREYFSVYLLALGIAALVALALLAMRRRAGRIVAWIILPLFLIFLPIGTIIGAVVAVGLRSSEMDKYVAGKVHI